MSPSASRAQWTESALVPLTDRPFSFLDDIEIRVEVIAVITLGAVASSADPLPTLTPATQVPLVEEITGITLFTEAFEPVFANEVVA